MSRNKGRPSGRNKSEGTGTPSNFNPGNLEKDRQITQEYTDNDEKLSGKVRSKHPNRNVDKRNATNAGGYKN